MDKKRELAKNTAIITIGKICTQFMSFFLMPLYTAVLSAEEYGVVDLVVTYTSLLMPVIIFQIDQALFRFLIDVREDDEGKRRAISTVVLFALFQTVVVIGIFCVAQSFVSTQYKWFLLGNVLACIFGNIMLQVTRGFGDNVGYAFGSFLSAATQILGNVLLIVVFKMGVYGMLIATVSAHVFTGAFLFIKERVYRYISIKDFKKEELKSILNYSMPLVPNALCWWALNASDRTIVLAFLGTASNGLLSVGHKFSSVYITFYNIFNISWTESAALHINDSDREAFFSDVIINMFKLFMCAGIGIVACMPFVFPVLINGKFQGAYGIIPIFMLASMLNVVVGLFSVVYVAHKKTKEIAKTSIYSGIINIIVHLVLVKFIGLYAAAISSAVAFGVMAVYRYLDLKKYMNIKLPLKWVVLMIVMYFGTCCTYYCANKVLQGVALLGVVAISVAANKSILLEGIGIVGRKIKSS
jgi:O-antigen/teichoic acid export membrane protein